MKTTHAFTNATLLNIAMTMMIAETTVKRNGAVKECVVIKKDVYLWQHLIRESHARLMMIAVVMQSKVTVAEDFVVMSIAHQILFQLAQMVDVSVGKTLT